MRNAKTLYIVHHLCCGSPDTRSLDHGGILNLLAGSYYTLALVLLRYVNVHNIHCVISEEPPSFNQREINGIIHPYQSTKISESSVEAKDPLRITLT